MKLVIRVSNKKAERHLETAIRWAKGTVGETYEMVDSRQAIVYKIDIATEAIHFLCALLGLTFKEFKMIEGDQKSWSVVISHPRDFRRYQAELNKKELMYTTGVKKQYDFMTFDDFVKALRVAYALKVRVNDVLHENKSIYNVDEKAFDEISDTTEDK